MLLPWSFGAVLFLIGAGNVRKQVGVCWVLIGSGGVSGYLLFALAIWICDLYGIVLLSGKYVQVLIATVFAGVAWLSVLGCRNQLAAGKIRFRLHSLDSGTLGWWFALVLILCLLTWNVTELTLSPIAGWDAVDHWAREAKRFVYYRTEIDLITPFSYWDKHPLTGSMLLAWFSWVSHSMDGSFGPTIGWIGIQISIVFVIYGFAMHVCNSRTVALIVCYVASSMPLIEAHSLSPGYMELPLAACVVAGFALTSIGYKEKNIRLLLFGAIIFVLAVLLKNIGVVYVFLVLGAWLLTMAVATWRSRGLLLALLLAAVCFFTLLNFGFEIPFGWQRLGYDPTARLLKLGGHGLTLAPFSFSQYCEIELTSRILNSSFSTAMAALTITICGLLEVKDGNAKTIGTALTFFIIGSLLVFALSLFTNVGYQHALPGLDTGHSRFTVPFILLIAMQLLIVVNDQSEKPQRNFEKL